MKNIFKCSKCKGQKVRTRTQGMICDKCELPQLIEANKPPRTGKVEKKGDREKLEKVLKEIENKELDLEFELSNLITKARLHAGFTQAKLARKMKTKQSSIARAEKGIQEISVSFLQKVAKAVGTTLILPKFGFEAEEEKKLNITNGTYSAGGSTGTGTLIIAPPPIDWIQATTQTPHNKKINKNK